MTTYKICITKEIYDIVSRKIKNVWWEKFLEMYQRMVDIVQF